MKNLQLREYDLKLVMTPGLMPSVLYRKTIELPGLMLSRATDILINLMMRKFQMIVSTSQTRTILIQVSKLLAVRNSSDKIDLVGKISTKAQAPADPFLDQLSKDLVEYEKQGPNIPLL